MLQKLQENYSYLFEDELLQEIETVGVLKKVPASTTIIDIGNSINHIPLLLEGAIKILREDENGSEQILYFLEHGDTCAMTLTCCLRNTKSEIKAITETDTELILIPRETMEHWISRYKSWTNFILISYQTRMKELLESVDTLAFLKMDQRLLKYLRDKAMVNHNDELNTTHQEIAYDLNTSRVVISRLLKRLENDNQIKLKRNIIKVLKLD